jgi:hypothetical protein
MSKELAADEKQKVKRPKPEVQSQTSEKPQPAGPERGAAEVLNLQHQVGNRAVQRLLAQRSGGEGSFELDEPTTERINQARGGGQSLDGAVQKQMGESIGHDFSGVRVHTSAESNELNQQLSARAFTTGQDIFFKSGEYNPGSGSGQELIAHELTHVVQQSSGAAGSGGGQMVVNPPDDVYEQEADAVAKQAISSSGEAVQRQTEEEELQMKADETLQREAAPEEEELQMKADETVQREAAPEEEELQMKTDETVQREAMPEEEELQMKADEMVQREAEEEALM